MVAKNILAACVLAVAAISSASATICDSARYPWPGAQPTFAIEQPAALQKYTKTLTGTLRITGNIKVIDGCRFQMVNIAVEDAFEAAKLTWYGVTSATDTNAISLTDQTFYLPGNGSGQIANGPIFSFTQVAGREASYYDFTIARLFSVTEQNSYASVTITGGNPAGNFTKYGIGEASRAPAPTTVTGTDAPLLSSSSSSTAATSPAAVVQAASTTAGSSGASAASGATTSSAAAAATTSAKSAGAPAAVAPINFSFVVFLFTICLCLLF